MVTCKDCIHFKICNDYEYLIGRESKVACPDFKSTEDVVPRAEVEKLQEQNEQWKQEANHYQTLWCQAESEIEKAKQEVAKQIFDEAIEQIENAMDSVKQFYKDDEDNRLYFQAKFVGLNKARCFLLDLKKKYIGE